MGITQFIFGAAFAEQKLLAYKTMKRHKTQEININQKTNIRWKRCGWKFEKELLDGKQEETSEWGTMKP